MSWLGHLHLDYRLDQHDPAAPPRTIAHDRHSGPLRVLQRLYPEGDAICHHVLVHPPGGIVGGDVLRITGQLASGSHALITTPGATRFYRSAGDEALQDVDLRVDAGARLEWLPLETIAYDGCRAHNRLNFRLAAGAEMMGWDILALGLPAARAPWCSGSFQQHVEIQDIWLDRAHILASDAVLLNSGPGWAGHGVLASLWFAAGTPLPDERRQALLDTARSHTPVNGIFTHSLAGGVTAPRDSLVVVRLLAARVEFAQLALRQIWQAWRALAWSLPRHEPRIWGT
jgi:urease accessory protein